MIQRFFCSFQQTQCCMGQIGWNNNWRVYKLHFQLVKYSQVYVIIHNDLYGSRLGRCSKQANMVKRKGIGYF